MIKGAIPVTVCRDGIRPDGTFAKCLDCYDEDLKDFPLETKGYFLTQFDLEQALREAFQAGQKGNYVESLMTGGIYFKHNQTVDDYIKDLF